MVLLSFANSFTDSLTDLSIVYTGLCLSCWAKPLIYEIIASDFSRSFFLRFDASGKREFILVSSFYLGLYLGSVLNLTTYLIFSWFEWVLSLIMSLTCFKFYANIRELLDWIDLLSGRNYLFLICSNLTKSYRIFSWHFLCLSCLLNLH